MNEKNLNEVFEEVLGGRASPALILIEAGIHQGIVAIKKEPDHI